MLMVPKGKEKFEFLLNKILMFRFNLHLEVVFFPCFSQVWCFPWINNYNNLHRFWSNICLLSLERSQTAACTVIYFFSSSSWNPKWSSHSNAVKSLRSTPIRLISKHRTWKHNAELQAQTSHGTIDEQEGEE